MNAKELAKELEQKQHAIQLLRERAKTDAAAKADLAQIEAEAQSIQSSLDANERRAANSREGYVYVISNHGSLGERVVKIGMTRRVDPMDRIDELGGASVPFKFDVHMIHYSDDAVGMKAQLHKIFAARRVNLVNSRKEHFYATPLEVKQIALQLDGTITTFNEQAEAQPWHESMKLREQMATE